MPSEFWETHGPARGVSTRSAIGSVFFGLWRPLILAFVAVLFFVFFAICLLSPAGGNVCVSVFSVVAAFLVGLSLKDSLSRPQVLLAPGSIWISLCAELLPVGPCLLVLAGAAGNASFPSFLAYLGWAGFLFFCCLWWIIYFKQPAWIFVLAGLLPITVFSSPIPRLVIDYVQGEAPVLTAIFFGLALTFALLLVDRLFSFPKELLNHMRLFSPTAAWNVGNPGRIGAYLERIGMGNVGDIDANRGAAAFKQIQRTCRGNSFTLLPWIGFFITGGMAVPQLFFAAQIPAFILVLIPLEMILLNLAVHQFLSRKFLGGHFLCSGNRGEWSWIQVASISYVLAKCWVLQSLGILIVHFVFPNAMPFTSATTAIGLLVGTLAFFGLGVTLLSLDRSLLAISIKLVAAILGIIAVTYSIIDNKWHNEPHFLPTFVLTLLGLSGVLAIRLRYKFRDLEFA